MNIEYISGWASILGFILAIATYFSAQHSIHTWLLAFILIIFIVLSIISFHLYDRNRRYLTADKKIRDTFNRISREKKTILAKDLNGRIKELSEICTEYAEAFEVIKNNKVGVCIKYINQTDTDRNLYVKDLCRDVHSSNARRHLYNNGQKDPIEHNTDFSTILEKVDEGKPTNEIYYFKNNLVEEHQYNNTHLKTDHLPSGIFKFRKRRQLWPLPYRSTIVVPILGNEDKEVCGFICIDSPKNKGFSENDDVPIVQHLSLIMKDLVVETISNK